MCAVQSTERAFSALTSQGSVIAWGDPLYGGCMKQAFGKLKRSVRPGWVGVGVQP